MKKTRVKRTKRMTTPRTQRPATGLICQLTLALLLVLCPAWAQAGDGTREYVARIHFRLDYPAYESGYMDNHKVLDSLARFLRSVRTGDIVGVSVTAYSSPEGTYPYNSDLCQLRLNTVRSLIAQRFPQIKDKTTYTVGGEGWDMIRSLVQADASLQSRSPESYRIICDALFDDSITDDVRKVRLKTRLADNWYGYLRWIHYRQVRICEVRVKYLSKQEQPHSKDVTVSTRTDVTPRAQVQTQVKSSSDDNAVVNVTVNVAPGDTVYITRVDTVFVTVADGGSHKGNREVKKERRTKEKVVKERKVKEKKEVSPDLKPWFALGSNVLYDALITPNVSLEIPMGKHWSLLADYTFPWWVTSDNRYAWEIQKWDLGLRYWIGRRQVPMDVLRGHFFGLDLSAGYYDIEPGHTGYQGEFLLAGLEYGYGFRLGTHWRLDLSIGAGWMGTRYRYYNGDARDEKLLYKYNGRFTWIGPTKVGVSFKYIIAGKKKVKKDE